MPRPAIVTFQIVLAVIATGILDTPTISWGVIDFFVVFLGGLLVGALFGWLLVQAIPWIGDEPLVHITLTLVCAYGAFIVADHFLHASGIMAVLSAGLMIGYHNPTRYKPRVREYLEIFWENAAFAANSLIFLMLGLSEKVFLSHTQNNIEGLLYPVLIAIPVVLFARSAVVYLLVPLVNRFPGAKPIDHRYRAVLAWGGLRGAVAIALAMSLPKHFPYRWQIIDLAFGVTLFTLLVNGSTMSWLMRRLGLDQPSALEEFMATFAATAAARTALQRIDSHQPVGEVDEEILERTRAKYRSELQTAETRLEELRKQLAGNRKKRHKLLWLQAPAVQRQSYHQRHDSGLLSQDALRALEWSLKRKHIGVDRPSGPVVENQYLPSERTGWFGLMNVISQVLPGIVLVRRWQARHHPQPSRGGRCAGRRQPGRTTRDASPGGPIRCRTAGRRGLSALLPGPRTNGDGTFGAYRRRLSGHGTRHGGNRRACPPPNSVAKREGRA